MQTMVHLDLRVQKCIAEFYVNDIPLRRLNSAFQGFYSEVAYPYLVDGLNTISLVVTPGPTPSKAKVIQVPNAPEDTGNVLDEDASSKVSDDSGKSKTARMAVVEYPVGVFAGDEDDGRLWMDVQWKFSDDPSVSFPCQVEDSRDLDRQRGMWAWQTAEPLDLDRDRAEIQSAVTAVHHAFENGDGADLAQMAQHYLTDMGRAIPAYGEAGFKRDLIRDVNANAGRKNWIRPIVWEEADFRLCADNRLVQIIDKNWQPSVRAIPQPDGEIYPFPFFLGKKDGVFQILL